MTFTILSSSSHKKFHKRIFINIKIAKIFASQQTLLIIKPKNGMYSPISHNMNYITLCDLKKKKICKYN